MTTTAASSPRRATPFVGRQRELGTLAGILDEARAGRGRLVLVGGDPGVGKTRLVEELTASLPPARVLWGRCSPVDGAPPYWPWRQIVRLAAERVVGETLRTWLGSGASELARLVPDVTALGPAREGADGDEERFRLFDAVTLLLQHVTAGELLVVVLDDLHWADSESLMLLRFVGAEAASARLVIVATYREHEMRQTSAVPHLLGDLLRQGRHVQLGGLDAAETATLAETSGLALPGDAVARLQDATGGNPFFVKETCAHLRATRWSGAAERLPLAPGVHEAVRRRLEPLAAGARRLLDAGAVLGLELGATDLADVAGVDVVAVRTMLEQPLAAGLLVRAVAGVERWRFAHALVRDTIYDAMPASERARLHRRVADVLEARHASALDDVAGEIAAHLEQALEPECVARAAAYAVRAAEHARATLGYEKAAAYYERALEAQRRLRGGARERLPLLLAFGEVQAFAGDVDGMRATLYEAARLARELGDVVALARAALGLGLVTTLLTDDRPRIELLREAEAALADDDPLRGPVLANLAHASYYADPPERRAAHSAEAIRLARERRDHTDLAHALFAHYYTQSGVLPAAERLDIWAEAVAAAEAAGLSLLVCELRTRSVVDHLELGDAEGADRELAKARVAADASRLPVARWRVAVTRTMRVALDGRLADAETLAAEALALGQRSVFARDAAAFHAGMMFGIRRAQGRLGHTLEMLEAAAFNDERPVWRAGLAIAYAEMGRLADAHRVLRDVARGGFAVVPRDWSRTSMLTFLADAVAIVGDASLAAELEAILAREAKPVVVTAGIYVGASARPLGRLALVQGRVDDAVARLEAAVALEARLGARVAHTWALADLAHALQVRGGPDDAERAAALVVEARAAAVRLGIADRTAALADVAVSSTAGGAGRTRPSAAAVSAGSRATGASAAPASPGRAGSPLASPAPSGVSPTVAPTSSPAIARLARDGDGWLLRFEQEEMQLAATKGVTQLVQLLRRPGIAVPAVDLAGDGATPAGATSEVLRARLLALREELDEAESLHDVGRAAALRDEFERLADAAAAGLQERKTGADAERARLNVTRAVRSVLRRVQIAIPRLGRHLDASIKTGVMCSYEPESMAGVRWEIDDDLE